MKHVVGFSSSGTIDYVIEPLWTLVFKYHIEHDLFFLSRHNLAQDLFGITQHRVRSAQLSPGFGRLNSALGLVGTTQHWVRSAQPQAVSASVGPLVDNIFLGLRTCKSEIWALIIDYGP